MVELLGCKVLGFKMAGTPGWRVEWRGFTARFRV